MIIREEIRSGDQRIENGELPAFANVVPITRCFQLAFAVACLEHYTESFRRNGLVLVGKRVRLID